MQHFCITINSVEDTCEGGVSQERRYVSCVSGCAFPKFLQLSHVAIEQSSTKRVEYAARIGVYDPHQLVFVDESAVDRRTTYRGYAWAIHGRKAFRKTFFCWG